jgi:nucleoside-diphosphate-sugar epimerase
MLVGDSTRLRATGWRPQLTLEQGLAAMVAPTFTKNGTQI